MNKKLYLVFVFSFFLARFVSSDLMSWYEDLIGDCCINEGISGCTEIRVPDPTYPNGTSFKAVFNLKVGDKVFVYDEKGELCTEEIKFIKKQCTPDVVELELEEVWVAEERSLKEDYPSIDKNKIILTLGKKTLLFSATDQKWIEAKKLDPLFVPEGHEWLVVGRDKVFKVLSQKIRRANIDLYYIHLKKNHNFLVSYRDIIVHNFAVEVPLLVWTFGGGIAFPPATLVLQGITLFCLANWLAKSKGGALKDLGLMFCQGFSHDNARGFKESAMKGFDREEPFVDENLYRRMIYFHEDDCECENIKKRVEIRGDRKIAEARKQHAEELCENVYCIDFSAHKAKIQNETQGKIDTIQKIHNLNACKWNIYREYADPSTFSTTDILQSMGKEATRGAVIGAGVLTINGLSNKYTGKDFSENFKECWNNFFFDSEKNKINEEKK